MKTDVTKKIVLLTESRFESPQASEWYIVQVLHEEQLLQAALERRGWSVQRIAWTNPDFDWTSAQAAVFRSTWDYFDRFAEFAPWMDDVSKKIHLLNPPELVRWNWDKHYLADLEKSGVTVPPTIFLEKESAVSLPDLIASAGWKKAILKPAISGGSRHTYLVDDGNAPAVDPAMQRLLAEEAMLLQPFQESILTEGEISLIVIGGRYTHAVRKIPKTGDFRVQDEHGGTVHPYAPTPKEVDLAERAVASCFITPLYARVDIVPDNEGGLAVMELELIEPELFFRFSPDAAEKLAEEIVCHLAQR